MIVDMSTQRFFRKWGSRKIIRKIISKAQKLYIKALNPYISNDFKVRFLKKSLQEILNSRNTDRFFEIHKLSEITGVNEAILWRELRKLADSENYLKNDRPDKR